LGALSFYLLGTGGGGPPVGLLGNLGGGPVGGLTGGGPGGGLEGGNSLGGGLLGTVGGFDLSLFVGVELPLSVSVLGVFCGAFLAATVIEGFSTGGDVGLVSVADGGEVTFASNSIGYSMLPPVGKGGLVGAGVASPDAVKEIRLSIEREIGMSESMSGSGGAENKSENPPPVFDSSATFLEFSDTVLSPSFGLFGTSGCTFSVSFCSEGLGGSGLDGGAAGRAGGAAGLAGGAPGLAGGEDLHGGGLPGGVGLGGGGFAGATSNCKEMSSNS